MGFGYGGEDGEAEGQAAEANAERNEKVVLYGHRSESWSEELADEKGGVEVVKVTTSLRWRTAVGGHGVDSRVGRTEIAHEEKGG